MRRPWVWLQVATGWIPVWALYAALLMVMHGADARHAAMLSVEAIGPAALLGVLVYRFTRRLPWPRPFRARFLAMHFAAAFVYGLAWIVAASLVQSVIQRHFVIMLGAGLTPFLVLGTWLYLIVAGVSYATDATERAARAEAEAARAQLQALRAQLHPHFVFNALHTVVQLIPEQPALAADAAEEVAHLLRATIEEDRDIVTVHDEWSFVERYLNIERLRFGERLRVSTDIAPDAGAATIPSFALQTLVENAVRHGAAPRAEPTDIAIRATRSGDTVTIIVRDTGAGADATRLASPTGSGLRRLRARLTASYGGAASLDVTGGPNGVTATLVVPLADPGA